MILQKLKKIYSKEAQTENKTVILVHTKEILLNPKALSLKEIMMFMREICGDLHFLKKSFALYVRLMKFGPLFQVSLCVSVVR